MTESWAVKYGSRILANGTIYKEWIEKNRSEAVRLKRQIKSYILGSILDINYRMIYSVDHPTNLLAAKIRPVKYIFVVYISKS